MVFKAYTPHQSRNQLSPKSPSFTATQSNPPFWGFCLPERTRGLKRKGQKLLKTSRKKICSQKIFQKILKIEDVTFIGFRVSLDIFLIFAEDCFLLRRFFFVLRSGFLLLSRFQASSIVHMSASKMEMAPFKRGWRPPSCSLCRELHKSRHLSSHLEAEVVLGVHTRKGKARPQRGVLEASSS